VEQDSLLWRVHVPTDSATAETATPLLRVGPGGAILSTNAAFRRLVGPAPRQVDRLLLDPPLRPGHVHLIASTSGPLERLVIESGSAEQSRELLLLPPVAAASAPSGEVWDAVEDLPVPLLKLSPTGVVLASNRHARSLLPTEAGARLSDLLEGLGRPICEWVADVAAGRPTPGPQVLRGSGNRQDTVLRVALNRAGGPDEAHLIAVLDDVSEFKALEAQFVQSQKMQALGQLAGGVAHDFNNLLTAISGHCDLLLLKQDEQDPEYGDLIQIRHNVNRAASLVGQLLAFSRKQSMMPETLDLRVALADLTHLLNRLVGEKVSLHLDHDPSLDHVRADKRQLEQVIMNLVVNARDAMPDGGEILIQTENRHLSEALPCGRAVIPPGRYVLVRVIDQGTGIPPDRLPKIFEPFYTTKKLGEGTGLGLSTAYGIVKQSGGYIFAESEVGRGTVFTLWFPAHGKPAAKTPSVARPQAAFREVQGVVLLVEDEAPVRAFAVRALRMRGYTVLEADSGEAALELLEALDTPVDLIVTDVILPGKDGPTWVREAVESRPETRVVFVSGYAEDAFGEQKALIPGSVFLPKPFSLGELTSLVERQLTWARADDSVPAAVVTFGPSDP
jgi:two-component system cell cycle sensor histidine kinase/response regulator CckA